MNAVCGLDWSAIDRMKETRLVNEGAMAEQFIGQHLQDLLAGSPNRDLTYWLREGRSSNAEVDCVAAFDGRIVPVEVKAGASGALKSLHQFVAEKEVSIAVRFDAAPASIQTVRTSVQRGNANPTWPIAWFRCLAPWNGCRPCSQRRPPSHHVLTTTIDRRGTRALA